MVTERPSGHALALASLVLGFISLPLAFASFNGAPLLWLTSIPAIIFGISAVWKTRGPHRNLKDRAMAVGGLCLGFFATFVLPLVVASYSRLVEKHQQTVAISNCREIFTALRIYERDHGGSPGLELTPLGTIDSSVPPARDSNEAFRHLFKAKAVENETIFGCPLSPFRPDGNIGVAPDYLEALKPGENHWAMTGWLSDSASGEYPVVYENPSEATWPPKWNADLLGQPKPGRPWSNGGVIIGFNDSTVQLMPLEAAKGGSVGLKARSNGKPVFPDYPFTPGFTVLNVAK
jgi:hypothetical protein